MVPCIGGQQWTTGHSGLFGFFPHHKACRVKDIMVLTILMESSVSMCIASSERGSLILTVNAGALHVG